MAPPSVVSEMVKAFIKAPKAMTSSIEASYRVGGNDKTSLIPGGKDRGLPRDVGGTRVVSFQPKIGRFRQFKLFPSLRTALICGRRQHSGLLCTPPRVKSFLDNMIV